ncbi:uncharacterized protein LOC132946768 isoform X1 [Metopolophium dirhodum]|uniref:uncharacterized protein LOC132946768 isoform X1 n=1 Tax=Metopolophium dirhodum TaxID=44670 RepID=UPI00298F739A|nr:uncharacterized protein LOC132946768 isoform X1 [Metopolophium dirhodum]XP_060872811.1 uncharacterized protein LOC132946768 isoform X1 [Metopolophium dirhodum]
MATKQSWTIGLFEEENKYSVLPSNWLIRVGENVFCQWPKKRITDSMIKMAEKPTKEWTLFPVKVIEEDLTYEQAITREKKIFLQASESDRSLGRGKRKRKMKFKKNDNLNDDFDESDSSAVQTPIKILTNKENMNGICVPFMQNENTLSNNIISDAIEVLNSIPSNMNIQSFQPDDSVATSSHNIDTQYELLDNNSNDKILSTSVETNIDVNAANCSQFGPCSQKNSIHYFDDLRNVYGNSTNLDEMVAKTIDLCISTNSYVKRIDARIDKIEKLLESNTAGGYYRNSQQMFDEDFISLFPMKDIQTINDVDTKIKNDSKFECQMKAFITTIGGTDIKNFVKRILHRMFTNELSSKCSWTGFRTNYKLENLKLMSIIKDIAREHFKGTDISFENHVKDWFRHGTQRLSREKERQQ